MRTTRKAFACVKLTKRDRVNRSVKKMLRREAWELFTKPSTSYRHIIDRLRTIDTAMHDRSVRDWWEKLKREVQVCLAMGWAHGCADQIGEPLRRITVTVPDRRDQCLLQYAILTGQRIAHLQRSTAAHLARQPQQPMEATSPRPV